jgi:hypothetical protein
MPDTLFRILSQVANAMRRAGYPTNLIMDDEVNIEVTRLPNTKFYEYRMIFDVHYKHNGTFC